MFLNKNKKNNTVNTRERILLEMYNNIQQNKFFPNQISLEEVFINKHPLLLKAEQHIQSIMDNTKNGEWYYSASFSDETRNLESCFEEFFNVEMVKIKWESEHFGNAYTLPFLNMDLAIDRPNKKIDQEYLDIITTKDRIYFKSKEDKIFNIWLYNGLFTVSGLTAPEILSVILHEIGHNFYVMDAEKLKSNYFFLFFNFIGAIAVWLKAKYPFKSQYKKYVEKYPTQAWLYKTISKAMALYNDIHMFIGAVLGFLFMYLVIGSQEVIIAIQRFGLGILTGNLTRAYRNEKFADNFATMLGYGPELAVGLTKLEKNPTLAHKTIINNIPVGAHIYHALSSFRSYLITDVFLIDPHPDLKLRIMDQRKKLEHELVNNKELTPVVRKVIEKQIAQLGDTYETLFTIEEDGVFQDKFALVKMFRFLYYKKLGVEPGKLSIAANINKTKDYDYNNLKLK